MCNINILIRKDGKRVLALKECANMMTYHSFVSNSDGEGMILDENTIMKSEGKILLRDERPYRVIAHERLTTSGKSKDNLHPHETKDLLLVHNGIFSGIGDDKESDTKKYTDILQGEFEKTKDLIEAIKQTQKLTSGSYSIVILEKKTGELYYYKNEMTDMYYASDNKYFVMSTKQINVSLASAFLGMNKKVIEVKPFVIYKIKNDLVKVGKLKKEKLVTNTWTNWQSNNFKNWDAEQLEDILKYELDCDNVEIKKEEVWLTCNKKALHSLASIGITPTFYDADGEGTTFARFDRKIMNELLDTTVGTGYSQKDLWEYV